MTQQDAHFRPIYHFTPPMNWMNDPNGLVYYRGEYHLFYQHHPDAPVWGSMHWGHAVSPDLIHWEHLPIALFPDEHGTIYSGSAVIDWDNTAGFGKEAMVTIFTHHKDGVQCQSLAYSIDSGRTWTKYAGNPVLQPPEGLRDFRDPKVFWYAENGPGHWVMVVAAHDAMRFYTSPDLIHWENSGTFGKTHGAHTGVWETPDLFNLAVEGASTTRWVLTAGIGDGGPGGRSGTQYFIGQFDGRNFISEYPPERVLWADFGADFYAGQSWSDEPSRRRIMIGWMNNWQYANLIPTTSWRGTSNLPRIITLRQTPEGIWLFQHPIPEVTVLRKTHTRWSNVLLTPGINLLKDLRGDAFEIEAEFEVGGGASCFGLRLRVGSDEQSTVGYLVREKQLFIDRTHSGQINFEPGFARMHMAEMKPTEGLVKLHIFLDRSCLEVFGNDGAVTIADTIFPSEHSQGVELFTEGGEVRVRELTVYEMEPAGITVVEE